MVQNKILSLLGLATRSRKVDSGEFMTEQSIKEKEVYLVIIAEDASDNTKKHFNDMCRYRDIPIVFACDKEGLGKSTGKGKRTSVGILDKGLADKLISTLREVQF